MSSRLVVEGDITQEELDALLKEKYVNRTLSVTTSDSFTRDLEVKLDIKQQECAELEMAAGRASLSLQTIHQQQQSLFDDFVILRNKYDETKQNLVEGLWTHCASYHPELSYIPKLMDESETCDEETKIGNYFIESLLGEGQFATVKACYKETDDNCKLACKMIKKERILTFSSLKRVSNEIFVLGELSSKYVVKIFDVMQSSNKLYIFTERGGADLFDFFDAHPEGVPLEWAKSIVAHIMKAVQYIHVNNICHRDLKPENVLLDFDEESGCCNSLKLCDFGLSTTFHPKKLLTEFCGSPGFFAPEMIIHGSYLGDKADIWSVGCIVLELVMGHEQFCDVWMSSYDYDVLQDKAKFTDEINTTSLSLPDTLSVNFPTKLCSFLIEILKVRTSERASTEDVIAHEWLEGESVLLEEVEAPPVKNNTSNTYRPINPADILSATINIPTQSASGATTYGVEEADGGDEMSALQTAGVKTEDELDDLSTCSTESSRQRTKISRNSPVVQPLEHSRHSMGSVDSGNPLDASTNSSPIGTGNGLKTPSRPVEIKIQTDGLQDARYTQMCTPSPSVSHMDLYRDGSRSPAGVDPTVIAKASMALEGRARQFMEKHNREGNSESNGHTLHLPPIDPPTPSVGKARKFLSKGNMDIKLLNSVVEDMGTSTNNDEILDAGKIDLASRTDSGTTDVSEGTEGYYYNNKSEPNSIKNSPRSKSTDADKDDNQVKASLLSSSSSVF